MKNLIKDLIEIYGEDTTLKQIKQNIQYNNLSKISIDKVKIKYKLLESNLDYQFIDNLGCYDETIIEFLERNFKLKISTVKKDNYILFEEYIKNITSLIYEYYTIIISCILYGNNNDNNNIIVIINHSRHITYKQIEFYLNTLYIYEKSEININYF